MGRLTGWRFPKLLMMTDLKVVKNINEIQVVIQSVRNHRKSFLTNFFPETFKHGIWIKKNQLELISLKETYFLIYSDNGFKRLFYISSCLTEITESLDILKNKYPDEKYVTDLVGKGDMLNDIYSVFLNTGFTFYSSLTRMSSTKYPTLKAIDPSVDFADISEVLLVDSLFKQYFDKYTEQLPLIEELKNWIEKKQMLVYRSGKEIGGFLIFDKTSSTAYLRYWFVHPNFRDLKIGSKLINQFFIENKDAIRILFWVIETNENAIKRYKHYGFHAEELRDIVLIYNIPLNER